MGKGPALALLQFVPVPPRQFLCQHASNGFFGRHAWSPASLQGRVGDWQMDAWTKCVFADKRQAFCIETRGALPLFCAVCGCAGARGQHSDCVRGHTSCRLYYETCE